MCVCGDGVGDSRIITWYQLQLVLLMVIRELQCELKIVITRAQGFVPLPTSIHVAAVHSPPPTIEITVGPFL